MLATTRTVRDVCGQLCRLKSTGAHTAPPPDGVLMANEDDFGHVLVSQSAKKLTDMGGIVNHGRPRPDSWHGRALGDVDDGAGWHDAASVAGDRHHQWCKDAGPRP